MPVQKTFSFSSMGPFFHSIKATRVPARRATCRGRKLKGLGIPSRVKASPQPMYKARKTIRGRKATPPRLRLFSF